jgi:hypothetical protein
MRSLQILKRAVWPSKFNVWPILIAIGVQREFDPREADRDPKR